MLLRDKKRRCLLVIPVQGGIRKVQSNARAQARLGFSRLDSRFPMEKICRDRPSHRCRTVLQLF